MNGKTITRGHVWASLKARDALETLVDMIDVNAGWYLNDYEKKQIEEARNAILYYDCHGLTEDDMPESEVA